MKEDLRERFKERYKSLNERQREAVDTIDGPVMVIAGPGTGKTTVLTLRIANILERTDTPPHGILAITFTNSGVKSMREKLRGIIGVRAHEVAIHTFHSFASAMMSEYPDHFLHLEGLRQMTDVEQESLIREILEEKKFRDLRPLGKPDAYVSAIMRAIDDSKREALSPSDVREYAKAEMVRIEGDEASISTRGRTKGKLKAEAEERIERCKKTMLFADVYSLYEERKREAKQMDFSDYIFELLLALKEDELFLRLLQERFIYILVDEHQDTNDAQNLLVSLVAEFFDTPNIFIVGDEKQAIYRFQGASVENFLHLEKRWPTMKMISLEENYRSHQSILDASFSLAEQNYEEGEHEKLRIRLLSRSGDKERPLDLVEAANTAALEDYLISEIKKIRESEPQATAAIICRRNRDVERVIRLLESKGMPVSSERSVDIFHHPVGAVFFHLAEYLRDPLRYDSLARTLAAGLWGLGFSESVAIIQDLRAGKTEGLEKKIPELGLCREKMLKDGAVGFLIHAAEMSGFASLVALEPERIHVWRGIVTLAESIARDRRIESPPELLEALLAYKLSAETRMVKVSVGAPDLPLLAMTAHGSKGLEFDYVFLPYATEESWMSRARGASFVLPQKRAAEHDVSDTRRLFYVALTRARKHVSILTSLEESDGKELSPLRFISELPEKLAARVVLPRRETSLPEGGEKKDDKARYEEEILALAKDTLLRRGLSVTALNHYLECPNKFIYESVLRMPQAPSTSAEKGSAMHEAISLVWSLEERSVQSIEKRLVSSIGEYLDESLLGLKDKEALRTELLEAAPKVASALLGHFSAQGPVFAERWVETVFSTKVGGEDINIEIHGKLDAVVEGTDEVCVYDYKTRKAMSQAEIKGETKNSDGNYFRQLAFYKLLLAGDPRWQRRKTSVSLVFVSPDKNGRCPIVSLPVSQEDIDTLKGEIRSLVSDVWSGEIAKAACGRSSCEYCSLRQVV